MRVDAKCRLVGMADEVDSKSIGGDTVRVQVPRPALLGRGKTVGNPGVIPVSAVFL